MTVIRWMSVYIKMHQSKNC